MTTQAAIAARFIIKHPKTGMWHAVWKCDRALYPHYPGYSKPEKALEHFMEFEKQAQGDISHRDLSDI